MPKRPKSPPPPITLAERTRMSLGLTRADLAERTGLSADTIHDLERRKRFPTDETLWKLAPVLKLDAGDLKADFMGPAAVLA